MVGRCLKIIVLLRECDVCMGKSLSMCIREGSVDEFKKATEDGAQVTVNNLIAAAWLGQKQILEYITTNYTAENKKVELLSAVFSQIGNKNIPETALIDKLLKYLSDIYYGGSRRFVLKKFEYNGFIWFLQLENPNRDTTLSGINQMFLTTQKRVADAKGQFADYRDYLKSYDFILSRQEVEQAAQPAQCKNVMEILDSVETTQPAMSMMELSTHMHNIELYRGSKMFDIVLEEWLKYLRRTVMVQDREKYYSFARKNNIGDVEQYKKLTLSTNSAESELLISWYKLLAKYQKYNR